MKVPSNLEQTDKQLYLAVDEVLHYMWDPIGVAGTPEARDEYDAYVPQAFSLLKRHASTQELAQYLQGISDERMGVGRQADRADQVAVVLEEWRDYFNERHA